jgi:lipid A 3-O-deacylase
MKRFLLSLFLLGCGPGTYSLKEENDYFTFLNNDSNYTQGVEFSHENDARHIGFGQRIYTPVHKKISDPLPDERPYAGYIYGAYTEKIQTDNPLTTARYGLEVGLVGPDAFGKETQCGVHSLLDQACPKGWHNQLKNELGLTFRLGLTHREPQEFLFTKGFLSSNLYLELGNISTALIVGSSVEYQLTPWLFFFAGPNAHFVARDIFLDGNTIDDSLSVNKKWYYSDLVGGLKLKLWNVAIRWALSLHSKQYVEQEGSYHFGTVTISLE